MDNAAVIRSAFFFAVFFCVAVSEAIFPRRKRSLSRLERWRINLGVIALNALVIKLVFPAAAIAVALAAQQSKWGLLNHLGLSYPLSVFMGVLLLDFVIYLQHLMFHAVPLLWRLHMVHHADLDIDVTTGLRFHPIEIILSMIIKMAAVAAIGPPVSAVLIFEIVLNGMAMFNHGNIRLPAGIDRFFRLIVVTPDMHRVHHSVIIRETNSNFGFNFSWWDRIFGTYRSQPAAGHEDMAIGLSQFRKSDDLTLSRILILPVNGDPGRYSL